MSRLVLITGAGRGLGKASAEHFAAAGWDVIALGRNLPAFPGDASPAIQAVRGDVREDLRGVLTEAVAGRALDVLINNAVVGSPHNTLSDVVAEDLLDALDVNVAGPLRVAREVLPALLAAPEPLIVNVSSRLGSLEMQARGDFADVGTSYAYRLSKAALNMLTIALAQEYDGRLRCWAVHPGQLSTGLGRGEASKSPQLAAAELHSLVESGDPRSPRFCDVGSGAELPW